jgi:hypothetical protein
LIQKSCFLRDRIDLQAYANFIRIGFMRRLRRFLLNAVTVLSLLLFVGAAIAWPVSYGKEMAVGWYDQDDVYLLIVSYRGGIYLSQTYDEPIPTGALLWEARTIGDGSSLPTGFPARRLVPISYYRGVDHPARLIGVSYWYVMSLCGALPVRHIVRRRRAR